MPEKVFEITAEWDDEAKVWYVSKSDVPGLAAEADNAEELVRMLRVLVPELLEANGVIPRHDKTPEIPFRVMLDRLKSGPLPC